MTESKGQTSYFIKAALVTLMLGEGHRRQFENFEIALRAIDHRGG